MKLSKQRKVYVAIFALAVSALGVDRLFLAGGEATPSPAHGGTVSGASVQPSPAPSGLGGDSAGAAKPPAEPLAERLRKLSKKQGIDMKTVKDAFSCSPQWFPRQEAVPTESASEAEASQFRSKHELMAVMAGARGSAIIDGKCLLVGQKLGEYELISVGERCAVFQRGGRRVTLTLKE